MAKIQILLEMWSMVSLTLTGNQPIILAVKVPRLSPWLSGGVLALSLALLTMLLANSRPSAETPAAAEPSEEQDASEPPCPSGTLPDQGVCVPVPSRAPTAPDEQTPGQL